MEPDGNHLWSVRFSSGRGRSTSPIGVSLVIQSRLQPVRNVVSSDFIFDAWSRRITEPKKKTHIVVDVCSGDGNFFPMTFSTMI